MILPNRTACSSPSSAPSSRIQRRHGSRTDNGKLGQDEKKGSGVAARHGGGTYKDRRYIEITAEVKAKVKVEINIKVKVKVKGPGETEGRGQAGGPGQRHEQREERDSERPNARQGAGKERGDGINQHNE